MSKRIDIFSPNSIRLIFSNITTIYKFQRKFLEALRKGIEQNQVAKVFLKMVKTFPISIKRIFILLLIFSIKVSFAILPIVMSIREP